jgi:hypothetical protein
VFKGNEAAGRLEKDTSAKSKENRTLSYTKAEPVIKGKQKTK